MSDIKNAAQRVKGKVFPVRTMYAYRGSRGIAPFIRNLDARQRCMFSFTFGPFYSRERIPLPIE